MFKKKLLAAAVVAGLAVAASGSASAYTLNIGGGFGSVQFNTIDWNQNGSAYISGFSAANPTFNLTAISQGVTLSNNSVDTASLGDTTGTNFSAGSSTFELTLKVNLVESIKTFDPVTGTATFNLQVGNWAIYYDPTPEANNLITGLGFSDGTKILGGTFAPGASGSFTATAPAPGGNGFGFSNLSGIVNYVDPTFVTPPPAGTTFTTTLQYGAFAAGWTRPTTIDGLAIGADSSSNFVLKADANQNFVPEPGSLALAALGVLGMAAAMRRKAK